MVKAMEDLAGQKITDKDIISHAKLLNWRTSQVVQAYWHDGRIGSNITSIHDSEISRNTKERSKKITTSFYF